MRKVRRAPSTHASLSPPGPDLLLWSSAALLASALTLGGGTRDNAIMAGLLELLSLLVLVVTLRDVLRHGLATHARIPLLILSAIALIPLLQLIPLPPDLWRSLPGREDLGRSLDLSQAGDAWRPFSLAPGDTRRSLLALLPPAAVFLAVVQLSDAQRRRLCALVPCMALASLALGIAQVVEAGAVLPRYRYAHHELPIGFFENRNHQAALLVAAIPFAAAWAAIIAAKPTGRAELQAAVMSLLVIFIAGVAATRSRAAALILGPSLIASLTLLYLSGDRGPRGRLVAAAGAFAAVGLILGGYFATDALARRFDIEGRPELRFEAWPVIARTAADHLPLGSGIGSFDPVYRAAEPLSLVSERYFNHAHNDYLELWLETGWIGALLLLAFLCWFALASARAWLGRPVAPGALAARAGSIAALALLAHSAVDYPLRTLALASVFAFACASLAAGSGPEGHARPRSPAARRREATSSA